MSRVGLFQNIVLKHFDKKPFKTPMKNLLNNLKVTEKILTQRISVFLFPYFIAELNLTFQHK